jgi:hypothetical protein
MLQAKPEVMTDALAGELVRRVGGSHAPLKFQREGRVCGLLAFFVRLASE